MASLEKSTIIRPTREGFRQALWQAIVPPLLLLAALAAFVSLLLFQLLRANDVAQNSGDILTRTTDIQRILINMETGRRGFELTGRPEFLEPFTSGRDQIGPALDQLTSELKDSPEEMERVTSLRATLDRWLALEPDIPLARPDTDKLVEGKSLMDSMRQILQTMGISESQIRQQRYNHFSHDAALTVVGIIGVSIGLGIALAILNRRTVLQLSSAYQDVLESEYARAAELELSNKQVTDLAKAIPQLVWISDGTGKLAYLNKLRSEYSGIPSSPDGPITWDNAIHPEDRQAALARWKAAVAKTAPFEAEYRLKRQCDGTYHWFLCRAVPVRDPSGKGMRWFGTCTDIQAQRQLAQQREELLNTERAARADLLRASQIKDRFVATLSHELRTPMTAILGWTRLLQDPAVRQTNLDAGLEAISSNARTQARLIDDLLDMGRILSGKLTLKPERIDLRSVVKAAVDAVGPAALAKKQNLMLDYSAADNLTIVGDPARLQQVVTNLLTNAVKFTPVEGRISVGLRSDDKNAVLVVQDNGQGLRGEFLPHVFEQFWQADGSSTRQHGGLGLGLAVVKHLVELHGGTVTAASEGDGRGATFTVKLPLNSNLETKSAEPPAATGPCDFSADLSGLSVLIVDDDRDTATVVQTVLQRAGASAEIAGSTQAALERMRQTRFDLLISDIAMPDVDGYELIQRLRAEEGLNSGTLAIALSAFAHNDDRKRALAAGYQAHLAKPAEPEQILRAVASLISGIPR